jgi:hypothetical protein
LWPGSAQLPASLLKEQYPVLILQDIARNSNIEKANINVLWEIMPKNNNRLSIPVKKLLNFCSIS